MPDRVKEKLVELLTAIDGVCPKDASCYDCEYKDVTHCAIPAKADFLIANSVTVQEWIPASEPPKDDLPVLVTCGNGYRPFVARYDLMWKRWRVSHTLKITHWQPLPSTRDLPKPPKGE